MSYSKIIIVNGWVLALVLAGCQNKQKIDRPAAVEAYISAVEARQAGQDAEAIARLEAALAANPNLTMARRLLADLYRETGEYDRARQHYEVTSKIDFYEFENHYFLGLMYQFLDRLQEAAAAYQAASDAADTPYLKADFLIQAGRAWGSAGDTAKAMAAYQRILDDFGEMPAVTEAKVRLSELTAATTATK